VRRIAIPLVAALLASPALAADTPKDELDQLLAKAQKEKKYVAVIFTLFN
jgi:hypothetical protein